MFGSYTVNYQLGKYTASSRPVDPVADWTENFKKIDDQMYNTESIATGITNSVNALSIQVQEQHTIIDGINNRVATTATKFTQIASDLSSVNVTVNQASTIAGGAESLATQANSNANLANTNANSALSLNSGQISQIADLRQRVTALENEQEKGGN